MTESERWTCHVCGATMSSTFTRMHLGKHMEMGDELANPLAEAAGPMFLFWGFCFLVGGFAGEIVTIVHRAL